ncbi:MAG TPA: hypothetical protein VL832_28130 [Puia sp.]|jgi:hypothetical protein|nr:hypothetical protein [Puia sp.]
MLQQLKRAIAPRSVIREIHQEFDTASEKLLREAKDILARPNGLSMANRLRGLGFGKSEGVAAVQNDAKIVESAALAEKYAARYPGYKFITLAQVEKICAKYNLVCGQSEDYKGDIPEKNVREIESFRVDESDIELSLFDHFTFAIDLTRCMPNFGFEGLPRPQLDVEPAKKPSYKFKICAPEKDFDMAQSKKQGFFLVPKDPIVLSQVKGGFLVVTKWGLEASDEIVVNQKMN